MEHLIVRALAIGIVNARSLKQETLEKILSNYKTMRSKIQSKEKAKEKEIINRTITTVQKSKTTKKK